MDRLVDLCNFARSARSRISEANFPEILNSAQEARSAGESAGLEALKILSIKVAITIVVRSIRATTLLDLGQALLQSVKLYTNLRLHGA